MAEKNNYLYHCFCCLIVWPRLSWSTMPHPKKKQRLEVKEGRSNDIIKSAEDHDHHMLSLFDDLCTDVLAHIFGFLPPNDIMCARLNNKMREAAKTKKMIVAPTKCVNSLKKYNAIAAMTTALPNLQEITLCDDLVEETHKYVMILHHADSDSSWAEAMRNQSGGELILARAHALARIQCRRLILIEASGMTYELVPPEKH